MKTKRTKAKRKEEPPLLNQLPVELAQSFWTHKDLILESPVRLYRWRGSGPRRYFTFGAPVVESGRHEFPVTYFSSVTTVVHETLPTSPYMIEWFARYGMEKARAIAGEAADYGTLMHIMISQFLVNRSLKIGPELDDSVAFHVKQNALAWDTSGWANRLRSDLMAFAQFAADYQLEPLAIEAVMCSFEDGIAGAIDCVARLTIREKGFFGEVYERGGKKNAKGAPKESVRERVIIALLDWKSSRKGFYPEHEYQLEIYKKIWMRWYGETYPIERLFNWRPNEWRTKPSYELKDQTGKRVDEVPLVIDLAKKRIDAEPSGEMRYPKTIELGLAPDGVTFATPDEIAREFIGDDGIDLLTGEPEKRKKKGRKK